MYELFAIIGFLCAIIFISAVALIGARQQYEEESNSKPVEIDGIRRDDHARE